MGNALWRLCRRVRGMERSPGRIPLLLPLLAAGGSLGAQTLNPAAFFQLAQQSRTAFTVQGDGARAVGTGGAFIAIADDATAVSYNPAGLAQLLRPEGSLVVQGLTRNLAFTGADGQGGASPTSFEDTQNSDKHSRPTFASFAVPWKREGLNTVLLFSYQRIFDFAFDSSLNYLATTSGGSTTQAIAQAVHQTGGIDLYSVGLGAEITQRILLGLSVNSWQGRWSFSSLSRRQTSGISETFDSDLSQDSAFRGLNVNVGLIWRSDWVNLGAVYRSPFTATYTFSDHYDYVSTTTGQPASENSPSTSMDVKWPSTLGWGLGLHLHPRLQCTADWSQTNWSSTRYSTSDPTYTGLNWFDFLQATNTKDVRDFHTGVEWIAWQGERLVLPLRAGYFKEPQPIVDSTTLEQRVLTGWTLGLGIKLKDLAFDLAFKDARDQRRASRYNTDTPIGGVAATALGTETLEEKRYYASLIYQFNSEAVRKALSWMFVGG
jgi:long-subunit fatty acid transport protein